MVYSKPDDRVLSLDYNVEVFSLPADWTYADFQALSDRAKEGFLHERGHNLVVNAGLDQIGNLILGINTSSFTHCGVGSDGTAAAAGQTALTTQIGSRVSVTSRYLVSTGAAHFDTFFDSSTGAGTWLEVGLFTASSGGTMLARKVISSFVKSTSNTAVVAYTVTIA